MLLARDIIKLTGGIPWWLSDPRNITLLQIFRCLRIIGHTSGWSSPHDPTAVDEHEIDTQEVPFQRTIVDGLEDEIITNVLDQSCEYTLDISFGVSMKTLRYLNQTVALSKIKAKLQPAGSWPNKYREELQSLENELFNVMDDVEALDGQLLLDMPSRQDVSDVVANEIKMNHMWAFHYAVALFFRRALCDGRSTFHYPPPKGSESTQRPSGQYLVSKALEHLENIDALAIGIPTANTLWPGFIAAVEATDMELRHRALIWFARARRHGIGNITKSKDIVLETWRRVDRTYSQEARRGLSSELGPVDWRKVMHEKSIYIMLT